MFGVRLIAFWLNITKRLQIGDPRRSLQLVTLMLETTVDDTRRQIGKPDVYN